MKKVVLCILLCTVSSSASEMPALWEGLTPGPYAVGVRVRQGTDYSRSYRHDALGVPVQLVFWYPAQPASDSAQRMTQLDYLMLVQPGAPTEAKRNAVAEATAALAVRWRHMGIVPQTTEQALAALHGAGIAVLDAPPANGNFPVVIIGGPFYLNTTAEFLASHGYLVVSAAMFGDPWEEGPPPDPGMSYEPDVRTQEWALAELNREPMADTHRIAAMGHGGGGMTAMLLAMRHRAVGAVVNLDGGNFSTKSSWGHIPFAGTERLRVPMLNVMRQETLDEQDLYADFHKMRYSERYELLLKDRDLQHHDLTNYGRGVSTVLKIRGPVQEMVLDRVAGIHRLVLGFLDRTIAAKHSDSTSLVSAFGHDRNCTLREFPAVVPAPSPAEVVQSFINRPIQEALAELRKRHDADPEASVFTVSSLLETAAIIGRNKHDAGALQLLNYAAELHPDSKEIAQAIANAKKSGRE